MQNQTLFSPYTGIHMNLALEQLLAKTILPGQRYLLLWMDEPSVVFGRFQNPWAECRIDLLESTGVVPARRLSGGGTVYHDLGNLNYSVVTQKGQMDIQGNLKTIAGALNGKGLDVHIGYRRDLFMGAYKISGSAFQVRREFEVHHGTLLVHTDLDRIQSLLSRQPDMPDARFVPSVPSPVINIGDLSGLHDPLSWAKLIQDEFGSAWGGFSDSPLPLPDGTLLAEECRILADRNWIFGRTSDFNASANINHDS